MNALIILLLLALTILSTWNFVAFQRLKSKEDSEPTMRDARYWELNYKLDFIISVTVLGAAVFGYLGYDSIENTKTTLRSELSRDLILINEDIDNSKKYLSALQASMDSVNAVIGVSGGEIKQQIQSLAKLDAKINAINSRNILQQEFYVVNSLRLILNEKFETISSNKFVFQDLTTESGDKLPKFKKPPLVIAVSRSDISVEIFRTGMESFEAYWGSSGIDDIPREIEFSVVILGK